MSNAAVGAVGGVSSIRLQLGMFTIFPANGVVLPGASIQVTVDMFSETSVASEEVYLLLLYSCFRFVLNCSSFQVNLLKSLW